MQPRGRDDRWHNLKRAFRFPSSRRRVREDVDAELQFHLEERAVELMTREHLSRDEAAEQANRRFGDVALYRRQLRTLDGAAFRRASFTESVSSALRELRQAFRSLNRARLFSILAMLTLALGLGASTTIFTLLDRIVINPLAYPHARQLIKIGTRWPGIKAGEEYDISKYMFEQFQERSKSLQHLGIYNFEAFTLPAKAGLDAERIFGARVSASMFSVLGVRPVVGRTFTDQEQRPEDPTVVLLSYGLWMRRFNGDPGVVGKTIDLDGRIKEIVGVLPQDAALPGTAAELWMPLHLDPAEPALNNHVFAAIGLLKPNVNAEQAFRELDGMTRRITADNPATYEPEFLKKTGFGLFVRPLQDDVVGPDITRSLWIIFASVGVVLLIAAANVASLFLIRIDARRKEIALRTALGAGRRHLMAHFLSESMLLAAGAAAGAVALAFLLLRLILSFAPSNLPRLREVHLDWISVAFCVVVALFVGAVFGVLPLTRTRGEMRVLREGGRGLAGARAQSGARGALVIGQIALSVLLLVAAGLLTKSFARLRAVNSGIDPHGVLSMTIVLPPDRYENDAQILSFWRSLVRRTALMPGVTSSGAVSSLPFTGDLGCTSVVAEDSRLDSSLHSRCVPVITVAPGYFATMRIAVEGQAPGWAENETGAGTMVVSRALATRLWPGESAIGHTLVLQDRRRLLFHVSGIAADVRADGLQYPPIEAAYFPIAAPATANASSTTDLGGNYLSFVVRSRADNLPLLTRAIRHAVGELDSRVPVEDVRQMDEVVAKSMAHTSFTTLLLAIAAALALTLSAIGLYGVISYTVAQRRTEIGIRMALGARMEQVRRIVAGQSVKLAAFGAGAGILIAVATMRIVRSLLFEVSSSDPIVLFGAAAILLPVAALASWLPARRASAIDPSEALRSD